MVGFRLITAFVSRRPLPCAIGVAFFTCDWPMTSILPILRERHAWNESGGEHGAQVDIDKDKAYLHDSDSEMSEAFPQEMVVAEELDEVVTSFEELDLEIVDLPEATEDGPEPARELPGCQPG